MIIWDLGRALRVTSAYQRPLFNHMDGFHSQPVTSHVTFTTE